MRGRRIADLRPFRADFPGPLEGAARSRFACTRNEDSAHRSNRFRHGPGSRRLRSRVQSQRRAPTHDRPEPALPQESHQRHARHTRVSRSPWTILPRGRLPPCASRKERISWRKASYRSSYLRSINGPSSFSSIQTYSTRFALQRVPRTTNKPHRGESKYPYA